MKSHLLNFLISISGIVTFKNATQIQEVARNVPLDRLLVETDSPYLPPIPHRGKRNESAFLIHTAKKIAEIHQTSLEEVAEITTKNADEVFPHVRDLLADA